MVTEALCGTEDFSQIPLKYRLLACGAMVALSERPPGHNKAATMLHDLFVDAIRGRQMVKNSILPDSKLNEQCMVVTSGIKYLLEHGKIEGVRTLDALLSRFEATSQKLAVASELAAEEITQLRDFCKALIE